MLVRFIGYALLVIVGFIFTIKGNPSYWQIIGLLAIGVAIGGAAMDQAREAEKAS